MGKIISTKLFVFGKDSKTTNFALSNMRS